MDQKEIEQRIHTFMNLRTSKEGTINAMLDMQLVAWDIEKKSVTLAFPISAWEMNPAGHLHGGIICTALDITMGCASYIYTNAGFTPTIQLAVNFVRSINEGEELFIEGICDHAGRRMVQTRAIAITSGKDEVVASANGSYAVNEIRKQEG